MMIKKKLKKYLEHLFVTVPEKYREEFDRENSRINLSRIRTAAKLIIFVVVLQALVQLLQSGQQMPDIFLDSSYIYYTFLYCLLALIMGVSIAVLKRVARTSAKTATLRIFEIALPTFLLFWALSITMVDQMNYGYIIFYVVALMAVGIIQYLKPPLLSAIYAAIHLVFLLALPSFQRSPEMLLGHYINSSVFAILGLMISRMLFVNRRDNFIKQKIIDEQHTRLVELNQQLAALSTIDDLTQIPNRRSFNNILEYEWNRSLREGKKISLIVIDVDYFKAYNDSYGHPAGDACLKQVAGALQGSIKRSSDIIARYGGDEFLALLPNTGFRGAALVAERVRQNIEQLAIPHGFSEVSSHVTVSVGAVTMLPSPGFIRQQLIEHADRALYQAKRGLRNRVVHLEITPQLQTDKPAQAQSPRVFPHEPPPTRSG